MPIPEQPLESPSEAGVQPASEPAFLILGRITRPHGVRGELRLKVVTDYPERIAQLDTVYVGSDPHDKTTADAYEVAGIRRHRDQLLIRLEGVADRDEAELLRGKLLLVALQDAVPLTEGEYYVFQVLGAAVVTVDGQHLGQVSEVLETGANDVFVVRGGPWGEVLIPDVPHIVTEIDISGRVLTVDPPPGLLPE